MYAILPLLCALAGPAASGDGPLFLIEVVDRQTGRGVPLVELETVHHLRYVTDSAGRAAIDAPELVGHSVWFNIRSHGYQFPADGFGFRGKALEIQPGGTVRLEIDRINVAERLYRVIGGGIYADSVRAGRPAPIAQPLLNAQVLGSDSVMNAIYRGRIYWFWGDTARPRYPLGNFHTPGATSRLPQDGGLDPAQGVDLEYFVDEHGFAQETARMPGEGPTWLSGITVLRDPSGNERMLAAYAKIKNMLEVYERGFCEFDPAAERFEKTAPLPLDAPLMPSGHPLLHRSAGVEYVYFADPLPLVRVPAKVESYTRLADYEGYTCLVEGSRLDAPRIDRGENGRARYAWRKGTPAVGPEQQARLLREGVLRADEVLLPIQDIESGKRVTLHRGSVSWNDYRRRWIMIATELGGTSMLGETWYAEADDLEGPWVYARKVVTHDKYSFYNPKEHPYFAQEGGRLVYFEGTYTMAFSGNEDPTPRYDYNQIMYRLDLADPRLVLPVAVYDLSPQGTGERLGTAEELRKTGRRGPVAFFALDRPREGAIALYARKTDAGFALTAERPDDAAPLFYGLPYGAGETTGPSVPLYEFTAPDGRRVYSFDSSPPAAGFTRGDRAICRVWATR